MGTGSWFKARPLHRRRRGRRRGTTPKVLNEEELVQFFGKPRSELTRELERLDWPYHRDSSNRIWATVIGNSSSEDAE
jgi:hypothetical protein